MTITWSKETKDAIHQAQKKKLDVGVVFYPEHPDTLENQFQRVVEGKKSIMLFHKLSYEEIPDEIHQVIQLESAEPSVMHKEPEKYPWLWSTEESEGMFVWNQNQIDFMKIENAIKNNTIGTLLGYGVNLPPEEVEGTFALSLMGKGEVRVGEVEKECVAVAAKDLHMVMETLRTNFWEPGDYFTLETRELFRLNRLERFE